VRSSEWGLLLEYDRKLLHALAQIQPSPWRGEVYRHMFASYPPDRENRLGARWNPPDVPAIYASLSRDTVLAEVEYQLSMEPTRPSVRRTLYQLNVALSSVLDLSTPQALASIGLTIEDLAVIEHAKCQIVGGAVEYMAHDGLLVPSARHPGGRNLVIYPNRQGKDYRFDVIEREVLLYASGEGRRAHALLPQHFLNFFPEPQGQGSLRPTFVEARSCSGGGPAVNGIETCRGPLVRQ